MEDDKPLALRRKRRSSTSGSSFSTSQDAQRASRMLIQEANSQIDSINSQSAGIAPGQSHAAAEALLKTPRTRSRKRVRFSDPFPLGSSTDMAGSGDVSTTGLTPLVKRTRLCQPRSPSPGGSPQPKHSPTARSDKQGGRYVDTPRRDRARKPHARHSFPARLPSCDTAAVTVSSSDHMSEVFGADQPVEFHFAPLRQILTPRARRQIKRNHLSEETNAFEADQRRMARQEAQIRRLAAELEESRKDHDHDDFAPPSNQENTEPRILELEAELRALRSQLRAVGHQLGGPGRMTPELKGSGDDDEMILVRDSYAEPASPCSTVPFTDDGFEPYNGIGLSTPVSTALQPRTPSPVMATACVQTSLSSRAASPNLESHIQSQTAHLIAARRDLEHLCPGETALPLSPTSNADVSPLLNALLSHLRSAKQQVHHTGAMLSASERQESNLRQKFNSSIAQLEAARARASELERDLATTTAVFRASKTQAAQLAQEKQGAEGQLSAAQQSIAELQREAQASEKGARRLRQALDKYRREAAEYVDLISRLEDEQAEFVTLLRAEHAQATSDLEAHVAAEERGRREAEKQVEQLELRVREAEVARKDLGAAMHLKQRVLRSLEAQLEGERVAREKEVGALNVRLAETQGQLHELEAQVQRERQKACAAVGRVVAGATCAGEQAVREVIGTGSEHIGLGLLTPGIEGGRFVNALSGATAHVAGEIETRRGKAAKRRRRNNPDSGIGILEEDESELLSSEL